MRYTPGYKEGDVLENEHGERRRREANKMAPEERHTEPNDPALAERAMRLVAARVPNPKLVAALR